MLTKKSDYEFVDVTNIPISGRPFPVRSEAGQRVIKLEDIAYLQEFMCRCARAVNVRPAEDIDVLRYNGHVQRFESEAEIRRLMDYYTLNFDTVNPIRFISEDLTFEPRWGLRWGIESVLGQLKLNGETVYVENTHKTVSKPLKKEDIGFMFDEMKKLKRLEFGGLRFYPEYNLEGSHDRQGWFVYEIKDEQTQESQLVTERANIELKKAEIRIDPLYPTDDLYFEHVKKIVIPFVTNSAKGNYRTGELKIWNDAIFVEKNPAKTIDVKDDIYSIISQAVAHNGLGTPVMADGAHAETYISMGDRPILIMDDDMDIDT